MEILLNVHKMGSNLAKTYHILFLNIINFYIFFYQFRDQPMEHVVNETNDYFTQHRTEVFKSL